jgi:hypothetical protein
MLEFGLGLMAGFLLWPWWAMGLFTLMLVADVVLLENNSEGWATTVFFLTLATLVWWLWPEGAEFWSWQNVKDFTMFLVFWLVAGILWSIPRAYFFLLSKKKELVGRGTKKRTYDSYISNNVDRVYGWIVFWPLSIVGFFFGDFLSRLVDFVMDLFGNVYKKMEQRVFAGWEE